MLHIVQFRPHQSARLDGGSFRRERRQPRSDQIGVDETRQVGFTGQERTRTTGRAGQILDLVDQFLGLVVQGSHPNFTDIGRPLSSCTALR